MHGVDHADPAPHSLEISLVTYCFGSHLRFSCFQLSEQMTNADAQRRTTSSNKQSIQSHNLLSLAAHSKNTDKSKNYVAHCKVKQGIILRKIFYVQ